MPKTFEYAFAEFLEETGRINLPEGLLLENRAAFLAGWCIMVENFHAMSELNSDAEQIAALRASDAETKAAIEKYTALVMQRMSQRPPP